MASEQQIYGWFDDPTQTEPTYNRAIGGPCLFCGRAVTPENVRTHSLMYAEGYANRSYSYRTHRTCAETDPTHTAMDGFVLDMIKRNGD